MEALAGAVFSYGVFVMGAVQRQSRMIFGKPNRIRYLEPGAFSGEHAVKDLFFTVKSGETLEGWCSEPRGKAQAVLLYFGGRKENVAWAHEMTSHLGNVKVYAFNYRGFGASKGKASEKAAKSDALELYDYIRSMERDNDNKVLIFGRSLGTSMALHVSTRRQCDGLVLVTPFESVRSLIKRNPAFRPAIRMLKENFYCLDDARKVQVPTSVFLARKDRVIPKVDSQCLIEALGGEKYVDVIDVANHNLLPRNERLLSILRNRWVESGMIS